MASNEKHHVLDRPTFDRPVKVLIVVAPYYKDIADQLVAGAEAEIELSESLLVEIRVSVPPKSCSRFKIRG